MFSEKVGSYSYSYWACQRPLVPISTKHFLAGRSSLQRLPCCLVQLYSHMIVFFLFAAFDFSAQKRTLAGGTMTNWRSKRGTGRKASTWDTFPTQACLQIIRRMSLWKDTTNGPKLYLTLRHERIYIFLFKHGILFLACVWKGMNFRVHNVAFCISPGFTCHAVCTAV